MPPRAQIPDDAQHCISIGGEVMAKYCRHCGHFVKGASAHFTKDHTGTRNLFCYSGSTTSPPPEAATRTQEALQWSVRWASPPAVTAAASLAGAISSEVPHFALDAPSIDAQQYMCRDVNYDLGFMGTPTP